MATEKVQLGDGAADQVLAPGVEPINPNREGVAQLQRAKDARRRHEPPPEGGLFDFEGRRQQDLF